jgi:hypothetical protein
MSMSIILGIFLTLHAFVHLLYAGQALRDCLKTRQKGGSRANLGDDQINSNLPD